MRPSYIQPPSFGQQGQHRLAFPVGSPGLGAGPLPSASAAPPSPKLGRQQPPLSPSARYGQQQQQAMSPQNQYHSNLPPGAAAPSSPFAAPQPSGGGGYFAGASQQQPPLQQQQQAAPPSQYQPHSYGPSATNEKRNSFSGNLAALASNTGSRFRRHSNTNARDANHLAVPGQGGDYVETSWTNSGKQGSAFMVSSSRSALLRTRHAKEDERLTAAYFLSTFSAQGILGHHEPCEPFFRISFETAGSTLPG